jgi:hypothetical protein
MARMVFTLADQAIDFLSEEQLKQIIENIKVAAASIR